MKKRNTLESIKVVILGEGCVEKDLKLLCSIIIIIFRSIIFFNF